MTVHIDGNTGIDAIQPDIPGAIPIGAWIDFTGTVAPPNFFIAPLAPTNISRTTYAKLFSVIGTTWGVGDGSTTFGSPYCPADQTTVQANGNAGGITVGANLAHSHSGTVGVGVNGSVGVTGGIIGVQSDGITTAIGSTGGSANLPAGVRVAKIVRYQ